MDKKQFLKSLLAFFTSSLLCVGILTLLPLDGKTTVIVGWTFIAVQAVVAGILFVYKKKSAAIAGAIWVGLSILVQVFPWVSLMR